MRGPKPGPRGGTGEASYYLPHDKYYEIAPLSKTRRKTKSYKSIGVGGENYSYLNQGNLALVSFAAFLIPFAFFLSGD